MILDLKPKKTEEIMSGPVLQQTAYWAKVKSGHGQKTLAFDMGEDFMIRWNRPDGVSIPGPIEGVPPERQGIC